MNAQPLQQLAVRPPLQFSILSSANPPRLNKRHNLAADGTVATSSSAHLQLGDVRIAQAADLRDFARQIGALKPNEAATYGLPVREGPVVTLAALTGRTDAIARSGDHFHFLAGPAVMLLDADSGLGLDMLLPVLFDAVPELADAPMLCVQSSSAGIVRESDGALLKEFGKFHLYVHVADGSHIEKTGERIQTRLWAAGNLEEWPTPSNPSEERDVRVCWVEPSEAGAARELTLLDRFVHQPERLDFAALPDIGAGLQRLDVGAHFRNIDKAPLDLCTIKVTTVQSERAAANKIAAHARARPALDAAREAYVLKNAHRLAERRTRTTPEAAADLARVLDRRELPEDWPLTLEGGGDIKVADVLADPDKYEKQRFADPVDPGYRGDGRIAYLFVRAGRPFLFSHAHGECAEYALQVSTEAIPFGHSAPGTIEDAVIVASDQAAVSVQVAPGVLNPAQLAHLTPLPASEDALALSFVDEFASQFRFTPGMNWMVNAGHAWERDRCLQHFDAARRVCRAAAAEADVGAEKKRLSKAATTAAVLQFARSDLRLIVPPGEWDRDPMELNTPAGVVDLRDGTLRPRAGQLHTLCTSVGPDMAAAAPVFTRFIHDVFLGDAELIAFMQRAMGYTLTGDRREQVLFFWHGSGSNGKSTLFELLQYLMGSYSLKIAGATLMTARHDRHPTEIAQLLGRRLACSSELEEGVFFDEPKVKELTGDATASARFVNQDFFEFKQTQKHLIIGNFKPRLRGGDPAMARRIVLVPFAAHFTGASKDMLMPDKLRAEAPAILAWMIRGALNWQAQGLRVPPSVRAASAEYMQAHDDLQLWRDERCAASGESKAGELYADFKNWKELRGEHAPSATSWYQRLESQAGITKRKSGGMLYGPIALRSTARFGALQ